MINQPKLANSNSSPLSSAFVLHSRPYRETSLLLELFTQDAGRVSALVRGVRKSHSRTAGLLVPFVNILVVCRGKGDLLTVQNVEASGHFYTLTGNALFCGLYANELLYRLLHRHDPHPGLFESYQKLLQQLNDGSVGNATNSCQHMQWQLRLFEKRMLQEIGYGIQWDRTAAGELVVAEQHYEFKYGAGFIPAGVATDWAPIERKNIGFSGSNSSSMQQAPLAKGSSLLALHRADEECSPTNSSISRDCNAIIQHVLYHLLGDKFLRCSALLAVMPQ